MSRQTKATIVSTALKLVGSSAADLQTEAELWLDLILAEAAQTYAFPELQRTHTASVASGLSNTAFPTDYGFLIRDGSQRGAVGYLLIGSERQSVFQRTLSDLQIGATASGLAVAEDRYASQFLCYMGDQGGSLVLCYQAIPASADSTAVVWYPSDLELVQQVRFLAENYMRGNLIQVTAQLKEAARVLSLRSPSRTRSWNLGAPGADLDPRFFV